MTIQNTSFAQVTEESKVTSNSTLNQLVDVVQEDVSGSTSRRKYQIWVTGGIGPGITSSLFQTIYDQDFTLQTANPIFDMTMGLYWNGATVLQARSNTDSSGKMLFPSSSVQMREKMYNYQQFAQALLGDATGSFYAPGIHAPSPLDQRVEGQQIVGHAGDRIEEALFLNFRRLFARDEIRKETFAIQLFQSAAHDGYTYDVGMAGTEYTHAPGIGFYLTGSGTNQLNILNGYTGSNLDVGSESGSAIYADIGASANRQKYFGGDVGYIKNTANSNEYVGLMWYDQGIAVLDMGKIFFVEQHMSGTLKAMSNAGTLAGATVPAGETTFGMIGGMKSGYDQTAVVSAKTSAGSAASNTTKRQYVSASFIPDLMISASIDQILDHVSSCRFGSGSLTATTFQNVTNINSTLYFCRAPAALFNYSSNPTYTDPANGDIVVVDPNSAQSSFSFVTTVGLYNPNMELMAVAKLSRPVEKNPEKDLTIRVRLDF